MVKNLLLRQEMGKTIREKALPFNSQPYLREDIRQQHQDVADYVGCAPQSHFCSEFAFSSSLFGKSTIIHPNTTKADIEPQGNALCIGGAGAGKTAGQVVVSDKEIPGTHELVMEWLKGEGASCLLHDRGDPYVKQYIEFLTNEEVANIFTTSGDRMRAALQDQYLHCGTSCNIDPEFLKRWHAMNKGGESEATSWYLAAFEPRVKNHLYSTKSCNVPDILNNRFTHYGVGTACLAAEFYSDIDSGAVSRSLLALCFRGNEDEYDYFCKKTGKIDLRLTLKRRFLQWQANNCIQVPKSSLPPVLVNNVSDPPDGGSGIISFEHLEDDLSETELFSLDLNESQAEWGSDVSSEAPVSAEIEEEMVWVFRVFDERLRFRTVPSTLIPFENETKKSLFIEPMDGAATREYLLKNNLYPREWIDDRDGQLRMDLFTSQDELFQRRAEFKKFFSALPEELKDLVIRTENLAWKLAMHFQNEYWMADNVHDLDVRQLSQTQLNGYVTISREAIASAWDLMSMSNDVVVSFGKSALRQAGIEPSKLKAINTRLSHVYRFKSMILMTDTTNTRDLAKEIGRKYFIRDLASDPSWKLVHQVVEAVEKLGALGLFDVSQAASVSKKRGGNRYKMLSYSRNKSTAVPAEKRASIHVIFDTLDGFISEEMYNASICDESQVQVALDVAADSLPF